MIYLVKKEKWLKRNKEFCIMIRMKNEKYTIMTKLIILIIFIL